MMLRSVIAYFFLFSIAVCLAANTHAAKTIPKKVCTGGDGWQTIQIVNGNVVGNVESQVAKQSIINAANLIRDDVIKTQGPGPTKKAKINTDFGLATNGQSLIYDACMKTVTKDRVVQYALVKYAAKIEFTDTVPDENDLHYYYDTNIEGRIPPRVKNVTITNYKYKDITNYD